MKMKKGERAITEIEIRNAPERELPGPAGSPHRRLKTKAQEERPLFYVGKLEDLRVVASQAVIVVKEDKERLGVEEEKPLGLGWNGKEP